MKLNTNLPGFYGYYSTIIEDYDTDSELQYINELRVENGLDELENDNDLIFNNDTYFQEWNLKIIDTVENFLIQFGMVKSIKFIKLHSPKFYNFENDKIEALVDVNVKNVKNYINENKEAFAVYLENNFKSRSGFISFYEHDLNFWLEKMKSFSKLDHIEINAILDFILVNEDFDLISECYNSGDVPYILCTNIDELTQAEAV